MSRNIPDYQPGHYYHVYNRGANKNPIFFEKANYYFLLKRIKKYLQKYGISVISYCLMPNHYHFLLRQNKNQKIAQFIQSIFNSYTKAINKKYDRSGTLFEGHYRAIHVDEEIYLVHLCRYIHRNPLEAKLVHTIEDWPWSNYLEWIEKRNGTLHDAEFIKNYFSTANKYRKFVQNYNPAPKLNKYLFN